MQAITSRRRLAGTALLAGALVPLIAPAASAERVYLRGSSTKEGPCAASSAGTTTSPLQVGFVAGYYGWSQNEWIDTETGETGSDVASVTHKCELRDGSPTGPVLYSKTETNTVMLPTENNAISAESVTYEIDPTHELWVCTWSWWTDHDGTTHLERGGETNAESCLLAAVHVHGDVLVRRSL